MRAVVYDKYGPPDVLRLADVDRPVPAEDELLVRIQATTVSRSDCGWRSAKPFITRYFTGLLRPKRKILGMELAGEVEAVGAAVTEFKVGDRVFGVKGWGAHAEFVCIRESAPVAHKPADITFEEAAAVCDGASIALSCLRRADLQKGQKILIYGASGAVGTSAVQLARHFGASVTGVCSTANLQFVASLGADTVIDYTKEDFLTRGDRYDLIFDAVPVVHRTMSLGGKGGLTPGGRYVSVTDGSPKLQIEDLTYLKELAEAGGIRPVIDRTYPLDQIVEAHRYVDTGRKKGNVVISLREQRSGS